MATGRMTSSAMHVASSLDGLSTTEYEMLDGTSSKGNTLDVGDLILGAEDDAIGAGLVAAMKEELSGTGLKRKKMESREPRNRILSIVGDILSKHGGSNSSSSVSAGRSLSPGDNIRFVPHPSSSGLAEDAGKEAGSGELKLSGERRAAGVTTESSDAKGGTVPPGKDDGSGIIGATVCFTPEPSPPSSPCLLGRDSLSSLPVGEKNSSGGGSGGAGSLSAAGVLRTSMATGRMTSSAMHVASSLDGLSTAEYEMLDRTSSKGNALDVGDLILGAEDDAIGAGLVAAMVPSLNETPFAMFKTPHQSGTKPPTLPDVKAPPSPACLESLAPEPSPGGENLGKGSEDFGGIEALEKAAVDLIIEGEEGESDGLEACPDVEASPSPAHLDPVAPESESGAVDTGKGNEDSGGDDASNKAGDMPSIPSVDHNYWEGHFGFVDAKGTIESSLHADALRGEDNIGLGVSEDSNPETSGVAAEPSGRTADRTEVADQDAGGADLEIPKSVMLAFLRGAASFVLSLLAVFGIYLRGHFDSLQRSVRAIVKTFFAQILHQNVASTNAIGSGETPKAKIEKEEEGCDDPPGSEGVNLMNFFSDEVLGAEGSSAPQIETHDGKGHSASDVGTLGQGGTAKDVVKRDKNLSASKAIKFVLGSALIPATFVMYNHMVQHGVRVAQSGSIDQSQNETVDRLPICPIPLWEITLASTPPSGVKYSNKLEVEDDQASNEDLLCFLTNTASFLSVPLSEISLSPTPFELAEEEFVQPHNLAGSSSWLSAFVLVSSVILLGKIAFKSKIPFPSIRPKAKQPSGANAEVITGKLTGMWTRDEHKQFLQGYEVHGKRWKLVSAFVPTRSETQVRSHGGYWLKMRSPEKMKRSRKATSTANDTPKRRGTTTFSSSSKLTPKQSNKTGARVNGGNPVPLRGILLEKDNNSMYKHVTPRSEGRIRRMKPRSGGCKSDPGTKRVRIVVP